MNDNEVIVASILVAHGAPVRSGDVVAEVETSKANVAIEAVTDGFVEWSVSQGQTVSITEVIGVIHSRVEEVRVASPRCSETPTEKDFCEAGSAIRAGAIFDQGGGDPLISPASRHYSRNREFEKGSFRNSGAERSSGRITAPSESRFGFVESIRYDLYRYRKDVTVRAFFATLAREPGFQASFIYRAGRLCRESPLGRIAILPFLRLLQRRVVRRYGISLPFEAVIGAGVNFPHWGGIWINEKTRIGVNVTIGHDVSVGNAGPDPVGFPEIGDNVYLSTGCRIAGSIRLGRDVFVAANSLVVGSAVDGAMLMGVPAREVGRQERNVYAQQIHPDFKPDEDDM